MICQLSCSIKNLNTIFSILGSNVANIRLNCCKRLEEQNIIKLNAIGWILEKRKYETEIILSSTNIYNIENELISYEPEDKWNSCCQVFLDQKDIWIPSTLINLIHMFPDEYFGELYVEDDGKIEFIIKDEIEKLFDNENVVTRFII